MASTVEYIEFVMEQLRVAFPLRYRKMFGEYMIYVNDKPLLLICNNTVHVKIRPETTALLDGTATGIPYEGAKPHYLLDVENSELTREVLTALEAVTPLPKPKKKKS